MGLDKFENKELIKYGFPEDIWFHVDKMSSAHVYLRMNKGRTIDDMSEGLLEDCAQLVKANSVQGNKMNNVEIVYTPWFNLKKTASMDVGQVGFHNSKLIVLDLDETLVCVYETSSLSAIVRSQAIESGLKCFELECLSTEKDVEGKPKVSYVTVFERPGLREFLEKTSEFANLVLFTAGLEGYARPLVDRIDVENRFSQHLYRPSTISTWIVLFYHHSSRLIF